jgi:hypothetical protein
VREIVGEGSDKRVMNEVNNMLRRIQNGELDVTDPGVMDRAFNIEYEVKKMLIEELNRLSDRGLI